MNFLDDFDSENNTKDVDSFKLDEAEEISSSNLDLEDINKTSKELSSKNNDSLLEGGGSKEANPFLDPDALFNNLNDDPVSKVSDNNDNNNDNNNDEADFIDPDAIFDNIDEEISRTKSEDINNNSDESNNDSESNDDLGANDDNEEPELNDDPELKGDNTKGNDDDDLDEEDNDEEAFITDDESEDEDNNFNIEFINSEPLKFKETHYLSDDKFIVNERQQRDDLLNEMMNTLPEK